MPALLLVAFALRVYRLGSMELWLDESLGPSFAAMGWKGLLAYLHSAAFEHPPSYYLLLSAWIRLAGSSEFSLRFLSVFWGVLTIPLLYVLTKRLAGGRPALLVALLGSLSPFLVAYSQEARMYSLLPCLAALALVSLHRALADGDRPGWWLVYSIVLAFAVATHYYSLLIWPAATAYVLMERPKRRSAWLWALVIQPLFLFVPLVWMVASPGPRAAIQSIMQGETAFGLAYKLNKVMPVLMASEIRAQSAELLSGVLAAAGWIVVLLGALWSRTSDVLSRKDWTFLMAILVIPLLLSLLIPYGVLGRHLGYLLISVLPFMALGLMALARRGRLLLAIGCLSLALLSAYGLAAQYTISKGEFGRAMAYIDDHGASGDVLVLTQPLEKHLAGYYNRREWSVKYLPRKQSQATPAQVDKELTALAKTHKRVWLGPIGAWTLDPDSLVEQWLAREFYQAEKVWFAGSKSVALYFAPVVLQPTSEGLGTEWEHQIRLDSAEISPSAVQPDDAVRLSFTWQANESGLPDLLVSLDLVDQSGAVWATRTSGPCGGLCPTSAWQGEAVVDHHALRIPPGTPPGSYRVRLGWYSPAEGRSLSTVDGRDRIDLGTVQVTLPASLTPGQASVDLGERRLDATFGDQIQLIGLELAQSRVLAGRAVNVDLRWLVQGTPPGDATLRWELVGSDGTIAAFWGRPPVAGFYPTGLWHPGEVLRSSQVLSLPGSLPAGRYRLRLAVLDPTGKPMPVGGSRPWQIVEGLIQGRTSLSGQYLEVARLHVLDRARSYDVPAFTHVYPARLGEQVKLLGYDLDGGTFRPGDELALTLYWQANGPTARPYKVFVHLGDGVNPPLAQSDGIPGGGCCPTDTWAAGEVVSDRYILRLSSDLPAGTYKLTAGMYEEASGQRLPVVSAAGSGSSGDQLFLAGIVVHAGPIPKPADTEAEVWRLFIPLVENRQ